MVVILGTLAGKFTDLSYASLTSTIDSLKGDFVSVSTAQALYGHPLVMQVRVLMYRFNTFVVYSSQSPHLTISGYFIV